MSIAAPAGEKLAHHFTADEDDQKIRIYSAKAYRTCPLKEQTARVTLDAITKYGQAPLNYALQAYA